MAKLFQEVIQSQFEGAFKNITFAIIDDDKSRRAHNPRGNYQPFKGVFIGANRGKARANSIEGAPQPIAGENAPIRFYAKNDPYFFLSTFFESPFTYKGVTYLSAAQFIQAQKFLHKSDIFQSILDKKKPLDAVSIATKNNSHVRKDWKEVREQVLEEALQQKFSQNEVLKAKLLATGNRQLVFDFKDPFEGVGGDGKGKKRSRNSPNETPRMATG
eukprot:TRINITY_DN5078_c0_g1_i3.p2 TRINITY_DN5078_c0_g1~~TRINITY_DN5078_c0_g1_i3.p2  ORF type:complete len:216 (-),score=48.65 TRINITY_DN5078_c0_g1_i3:157-804(-)